VVFSGRLFYSIQIAGYKKRDSAEPVIPIAIGRPKTNTPTKKSPSN